jgi:hypothetical protein
VTAYREICAFHRGRRKFRVSELEPLWHFVETLATARLFGVNRYLYDQVDAQVSLMNRGQLIRLALKCFLTPSLEIYLEALRRGSVCAHDAVMFYVRVRATLDWMEDNLILVDRSPDDGLAEMLTRFRWVVNENLNILRDLAQRLPEIRSFMRSVLARANKRFLTPNYVVLTA